MAGLDLQAIEHELIDESWKGIPGGTQAFPLGELATRGWNVARGDLPLPLLTLRRSAVEHNLAVMARFCAVTGVLLAPHGKTTMAPQLFDRQLAAGAWAITAATVQQLQVYRRFGVPRVVLANQVVGRAELTWLAQQHAAGAFELWTLVDSAEAVERVAVVGERRPFPVLLELGLPGGRTGARDDRAVDGILAAIDRTNGRVRLAGVEAFEGLIPQKRPAPPDPRVRQLVDRVAATATRLAAAGTLPDDFILSAGGSVAFDLVAELLAPVAPAPARLVLRSGCYLTHDHGMYAGGSPLVHGASSWAERVGVLRPALELWAHVQSQPEPGLALLTFGKRDAPFDAGLPLPIRHVPDVANSDTALDTADWSISALNDQHAYLRCPAGEEPRVGDRVVLGISHPCTAFDRWRLVYEVDDDDTVIGGIRTFF
ncbi:MAG: hypothetical protein AB7Q42_14740 [Acidimicrobiia bacterium]